MLPHHAWSNRLKFALGRVMVVTSWVLVAAGCGLADYEKHMDAERDRIKFFDEESKLLTAPLVMPTGTHPETKAEAPVFPVDIFVRPPAGVAGNHAKDSPLTFNKLALYRYPGPGGLNVFLAARLVLDKPWPEDTPEARDGDTLEEFWHKVRMALRDHNRNIEFDAGNKPAPRKDKRQPQSFKGPITPFEFDRLDYSSKDGKNNYWLFFLRKGNTQVGIVYEVPTDKISTLKRAVDLSLESLDIETASTKRMEYTRRRKPGR